MPKTLKTINTAPPSIPEHHSFGFGAGVKFQVYDYEPVEVHPYYQSDGLPGETVQELTDRVAKVVQSELEKRVKEYFKELVRLREEAFNELAETE